MVTLHFAIVAWRIGTDELVADAEPSSGALKQGGQVSLTVGKAVGEFKPVVLLDTRHGNAFTGKMRNDLA